MAQPVDRVGLDCAPTSYRLNASALSDPNALFLSVTSSLFSSLTPEAADLSVTALVDSGSTHCFIDKGFVQLNALPTDSIPPIQLRLFDGSSNAYITECVSLPITFPTGESMTVPCYITPLNSSCSVVLGHNWLSQHNPSIDWSTNCYND